jgi:hypothetical protein
MAVQCVYSLGGHVAQLGASRSDASNHLRDLFWLCYFFDKHISLRSGRPPLLNDNECSLSLDDYPGIAAIHDDGSPFFPSDLGLTILKHEVSSTLYSRSALEKSDTERLRDIRILDDRLEAWRLSVPSFARPRLSIVEFGNGSEALENKFGTWLIFIHLEYLYLISAIHRACFRCTISSPGTAGTMALSSSLALSVHASRATLVYLTVASTRVHGEIFW